ncbi:MAG: hypothetical protein D4S01_04225 [Dehalococcoidia bacterium]|nr:MAG: hypothetical protein D4S01_04225 [Dehalococcoidia bacterium]
MAEEILEEPWRRWVPVIDKLLWQVYYRILSFISFHAPIDEAYSAAKHLSETKGGAVYWVMPDRVFRFDNIEISPGIRLDVYFFGSASRRKNVVMFRRGWWSLYIIDTAIKTLVKGRV